MSKFILQSDPVKITGQKFKKVVDVHAYYYDNTKKSRCFGLHGTKDIFAEIQASDNGTDLEFIKKSLLNQAPSELDSTLFADVSNISPDMLENFNRIQIARDNFNTLPAEVRSLYNNDFEKFAKNFKQEDLLKTSFATPHRLKEVNKKLIKQVEAEKREVISNE